jgi:hypothetical protein
MRAFAGAMFILAWWRNQSSAQAWPNPDCYVYSPAMFIHSPCLEAGVARRPLKSKNE